MKRQKLLLFSALLGTTFLLYSQERYVYTGTGSFDIPCIIQAEDFIQGGEGVAYHDLTTAGDQSWRKFREGAGGVLSGVHCSAFFLAAVPENGDADGTNDVSYITTGEWLIYTINSATAKTYDFWVSVAGPNTQAIGAISVFIGTAAVPNPTSVKLANAPYSAQGTVSSNWNYCMWVNLGQVAVAAGSQKMRVEFSTGGANVNAWALTEPGKTPKEFTALKNTVADNEVSVFKSGESMMINSPNIIRAVSVFDFSGKRIMYTKAEQNNFTIPLQNMKGIFLVSVETEKGPKFVKVIF